MDASGALEDAELAILDAIDRIKDLMASGDRGTTVEAYNDAFGAISGLRDPLAAVHRDWPGIE